MGRSNLGARISANLIHALDSHMNNVINGYTPRKLGLLDQRISAEKQVRFEATYKARPDVKRDIMVYLYGGKPSTDTGKLLCNETHDNYKAVCQSLGLRYTENGDFTHLSGRVGLYDER